MRQYLSYVVTAAVSLVVGLLMGLYMRRSSSERKVLVQTDTVRTEVVKEYGKLEIPSAKIDIPAVKATEFVFIPEEKTDTIVKEKVKYITLPREYYYTRKDDVEIWHSGIDSSIDSLRYRERQTVIKDVYEVRKKNTFSIGIEARYMDAIHFPLTLAYERHMFPWWSMYGYAQYEFYSRNIYIGIGTRININW